MYGRGAQCEEEELHLAVERTTEGQVYFEVGTVAVRQVVALFALQG